MTDRWVTIELETDNGYHRVSRTLPAGVSIDPEEMSLFADRLAEMGTPAFRNDELHSAHEWQAIFPRERIVDADGWESPEQMRIPITLREYRRRLARCTVRSVLP